MEKFIIETAEQTSIKLLEVLNDLYPWVSFNAKVEEAEQLEESGPTIELVWLDGPTTLDVEKITMHFMTMFDGIVTGYEWNGQMYKGAYLIESNRTISPDRQAMIDALVQAAGVTDPSCFQLDLFEEELVQEGKLSLFV